MAACTFLAMTDSGELQFDDGVIRYRSAVYGDWNVPLCDVRIIGECTNEMGPADDYFLCFATGPGAWLEASFYANGCEVFLRDLRTKLGCSIEPGLFHSTTFASRVLWPPALAGEPMFKYADRPAKGLFQRLFGSMQVEQTYSEGVATLLAAKNEQIGPVPSGSGTEHSSG